MSPSELRELAKRVLPLVQEAGGIAHSYFCSQELRIDTKADGSPVTRADRETEERLRLRLAALGNSFGMIGEEFGEEGTDRDFVWVIDPIDGTRAFTRGLPYWALLLALLQRNQPVMGFLLAPALGVLASAWKGGGTSVNGLPVRVSSVESLRQSFITIGSLASWGRLSLIKSTFSRTAKEAKSILVPQINSTVTTETPSLDTELTRRKFFTVPIDSSMTLVSNVSISSGAALA